MDVRHPDGDTLAQMETETRRLAAEAAQAEDVDFSVTHIWTSAPTQFDSHVVKILEQTADELGIAYHRMVSGAGHDAKYMANIAPTAMIFVRSPGGQSHCPEEEVEWTDVRDAVRLLLHVVLRLAS